MAPLTEAPLHLDHGGGFSRTYAVADWPAAAWWGFWKPLLSLRDGLATPHPTTIGSREQTLPLAATPGRGRGAAASRHRVAGEGAGSLGLRAGGAQER